ncbi:MAG: DUF3450 family protein [Limisphaerales bacterium]
MTPAFLLASCCFGLAAESDVADTRATLSKWVEARQMISRLQADWREDRETLDSTIALFDGQRERLEEKLKTVAEQNDQVTKETGENKAELDKFLAALKQIEEMVGGFEAKVKAQAKNYPPPLAGLETVSKFIGFIPENPKETQVPVISRVQNLIVILKAVQEFNSELHLETEILKNGDKDVEVQTLYLGLGQAWFVDKTGGFAGTGGPSDEGWKWTTAAQIAPQVQKAIAVYEKAQPAAYVALPVEVK